MVCSAGPSMRMSAGPSKQACLGASLNKSSNRGYDSS